MSVKLEAGNWYRTRGGEIVYCVGGSKAVDTGDRWIVENDEGEINTYHFDGRWLSDEVDENDLIEHLPDCDGFDWVPPKPKLQLREGAWYERKDGKIVGPIKAYSDNISEGKWSCGRRWYPDDGSSPQDPWCLLREVDPPAPKYRPFANAEEFRPFRDKWWRWKSDCCLNPPARYSDKEYGMNGYLFMFEKAEFEDGTPFGVLEQP
jgi:hypothetical protein